jgi:hypothetical protein
MKEIKEYIYSRLISDSTLLSLLGVSNGDKRVYHLGAEVNYEVNEKKKGFIIYYTNQGAQTDELNSQTLPPISVTFDIYAISWNAAIEIAERLDVLFTVSLDFTTTNYRCFNIRKENQIDGLPSDIGAKRITIRFRLSSIIK